MKRKSGIIIEEVSSLTATFSYRLLSFKCACGNVPLGVSVGTTSGYDLLAMWKCAGCGKDTVATLSLEKLIAGVPPPPEVPAVFDEKDVSLLKEMHIQLEDS